jgi:phosphoribosylformylglycinamidine synthase
LIRSCHDLSEGGLAAAVAEMAFAGEFGVALDLGPLARTWKIADDAVLLFSETSSRFVVEVAPAAVPEFLAVIGTDAVPLGRVTAADQPVSMVGSGGAVVIETPWPDLKRCWQAPLAWD